MKDKLLAAIRLMYKNLGYSDKAVDAVASYLETTVTEEAQVDASVKAVEPMLKAFQSEIDGRVQTAVQKAKEAPVDPPKPPVDPNPVNPPTPPPADAPEWAKGLISGFNTLQTELKAIKEGKSADTRKQQLETALKDVSDAYKNSTLKAFGRMQFADDTAFNEYLEEVKTDSAEFQQASANDGLGRSGRPIVSAGPVTKTATKEELDSVMSNIKI